MDSFKLLEYNELNDVTKEDIILDTLWDNCEGGHSPNMGKRRIDELKTTYYEKLLRATDIKTFLTYYKDQRIGYSKVEEIYFCYKESSSRLYVFDTPSRLVLFFFYPWNYHDMVPLRVYTHLSLEDAKKEMLDLFNQE